VIAVGNIMSRVVLSIGFLPHFQAMRIA